MDDFAVKYEHQEYITHILNVLKNIYEISEDWYGKLYCGINLKRYVYKREVLVSMPKYVIKALHTFQHPTPRRAQYAPHKWTSSNYGATKQLATPLDTSPQIPEGLNRRIQKIMVTFLYSDRAVKCTMLPTLKTIADQQSNPNKNNEAAITQFIDYSATNTSVTIQYRSRNMILHIDSDASYQNHGHVATLEGTIT